MAEHAIRTRLDSGAPLILSSDPVAGLVDGNVPHPMGIGDSLRVALLTREEPQRVAGHYAGEIAAGIDLLLALTADSTGVGLAAAGMDFRAAAITGAAIDLALEAVEATSRDIMVAGVLGGAWTIGVSHERLLEELELHAQRLSASGAELIVARALDGSLPLDDRASPVRLAAQCGLPTVAWLAIESAETVGSWARMCRGLDVVAMIFEVADAEVGRAALAETRKLVGNGTSRPMAVGFQLSATRSRERGSPESGALETWCIDAKRLVDEGAQLIGGGSGTTDLHSATLSRALGRSSR